MLLASLLIGGSSVGGLPTTFILQLAGLCFLVLLIPAKHRVRYRRDVLILLGLVGLTFLLQLLPLGWLLAPEVGNAGVEMPRPLALTVDWNRTLEAFLFVLPVIVFFLVLLRLGMDELNRLLPFFLLGLLLNMAFALVQFSASSPIIVGFLPYPTGAGFFANQNHFAALLFVGIPFVIYQFVIIKRPLLSLFAIVLMVLVGFATRSVAGAFLSLFCAAVSFALIANMPSRLRWLLIGLATAGAIFLSSNPGNVLEINPDNPLDRTTIRANTIEGIGANMPFGTGFGTFEIVYPRFEAETDIRSVYINHAHNEYLELLLEGGLPALALIALYLLMLARAALRQPHTAMRTAALCGIVFLLIHSFVDYPLRTMGMALVFAFLNAIVFSTALPAARSQSNRSASAVAPGQL
ncbi:hypothetical protein EMQ25_11600 [Arsenicitalea aurantiaca]|uniref:O-antigen ligase-related domain-containing protein n=1 Tax=Arsenicitalea aurantiaca TaxID=1783274 RepID=A0A433X7F5_9HYPH|nr:O-antigen ligase family protein [Arsenicitalea aurantiaca]RUT29978.1 hypothetical protein EMQ25_11600 [Arsenicitalea aurantiaca]